MSRLAWSLGVLAVTIAGVANGLGAPHGGAWALGLAVAAALGLGVSGAAAWFGRAR